jgi:hypothetical protein
MQGMLEFGPLWLVALAVPTFLYGPHWAGLTSALGLGGLLGAQTWITRRWAVGLVAVAIISCCVVLALSHVALVVVGVQVLLTLLVVAVSIPVLRRLHDAVPSTIRAGVASGVGTLTWLTFVPFALVFGALSESAGVDRAGWLLVAIAIVAAFLIVVVLPQPPAPVAEAVPVVPARAEDVAIPFPVDRFLPPDDPKWPGHWAKPPASWGVLGVSVDGADALDQARVAITEMPQALREVIVLRDVEGATPNKVRRSWIFAPRRSEPCSSRLAASFANAWSGTSRRVKMMTKESGSRRDDLRCIEFVDLVTAYLDGEVSKDQRRRIDTHLEGCQGCRAALDQFQMVIRLAGRLTATDIAAVDPLIRDRLTTTLRVPRRR